MYYYNKQYFIWLSVLSYSIDMYTDSCKYVVTDNILWHGYSWLSAFLAHWTWNIIFNYSVFLLLCFYFTAFESWKRSSSDTNHTSENNHHEEGCVTSARTSQCWSKPFHRRGRYSQSQQDLPSTDKDWRQDGSVWKLKGNVSMPLLLISSCWLLVLLRHLSDSDCENWSVRRTY